MLIPVVFALTGSLVPVRAQNRVPPALSPPDCVAKESRVTCPWPGSGTPWLCTGCNKQNYLAGAPPLSGSYARLLRQQRAHFNSRPSGLRTALAASAAGGDSATSRSGAVPARVGAASGSAKTLPIQSSRELRDCMAPNQNTKQPTGPLRPYFDTFERLARTQATRKPARARPDRPHTSSVSIFATRLICRLICRIAASPGGAANLGSRKSQSHARA